MLEQKTEVIEFWESSIDDEKKVYLVTWSPDPKELPDCDFYIQHQVNIEILADYLKCCSAGLFCVESTQLGNPHYHGWYQIDDNKELARIALIKTLNRFGIVRITPIKHSYKIFSWSESANALYYYKKDSLDAFLTYPIITSTSTSTLNFNILDSIGFFSRDHKGLTTINDKMSNRQFYRQFYADTIEILK